MNKKKKLLIFGPANSSHLSSWASPFIDEFEVEVLTFHPPAQIENYKNIKVSGIKPITNTKLDYIFRKGQVQAFVDAFKPDIIHAHYASSYGLLCSNIKTNALKILTVWGCDINHARNFFVHRFFIDKALHAFDWINVPSEDLKNKILKIGVSPEKILVFQYGIDMSFCDSLKKSKKNRNEIYILSTRFWEALYNVDKIIEGFKIAFEKNPNLRLKIVGGGSNLDNERISKLIANHPGIVSLGFIPKANLMEELWDADIFMSIPSRDGMSLSVLEALYCGCFPILSDIPPNREILQNGTGIIVPEMSIESVANCILSAASEYKTFDLSKNIDFVDSRANYKKNMDIIRKIYNSGRL